MPIGAVTMILTNVGLQIFNNWCCSRQNKQLQQMREEFEKAAKERNTQRMWQIMREGQELTRQLEEEKHQQRLEELKNDVGNLLQKLTYAATINNWPLNVLPIVMKNQALGNLLANQEESVALHCIFTPSNSFEFNRVVFPSIEEALETYCNQHWSVMSDHPILFYSGTWKSQQSPTEVQIDSMRAALSNLPTLVITPFFRPNDGKLVFHVRIWGVGTSSSDEFSIPEIEPTDFQRNYQTGDDYVNDSELIDELVEDLVPYLQCLIGYIADTYFWSFLGNVPHLPLLITNGTINTDGMKFLVNNSSDYYAKLLLSSEENAKDNPFKQQDLLNLCKECGKLWEEDFKKAKEEEIRNNYTKPKTKSPPSRLYSIDDFELSMYEEKKFGTLDILQDVLVFLNDRIGGCPFRDDLYLFLYRVDEESLTSNIIDKNNMIHVLSPSVDFKFRYEKLFKARKIREFFCGKREKIIALNDIGDTIVRLNKLLQSSTLIY